MAYIGKTPTPVPLTSSDITNGIVSVDKLTSTLDLSSNTVTLPSGVGGKILQVQTAALTTEVTSNSTTNVDVGSLSITPTSSSSTILIQSMNHIYIPSNTGWKGALVNIKRGSTSIFDNYGNQGYGESVNFTDGSDRLMIYHNVSYVDSPNTTSATTYTVQMHSKDGNGTLTINKSTYGGQGRLTLMEIAG